MNPPPTTAELRALEVLTGAFSKNIGQDLSWREYKERGLAELRAAGLRIVGTCETREHSAVSHCRPAWRPMTRDSYSDRAWYAISAAEMMGKAARKSNSARDTEFARWLSEYRWWQEVYRERFRRLRRWEQDSIRGMVGWIEVPPCRT